MKNIFKVSQSYIEDSAFILEGILLSGTINKDMYISVPFNRSLNVTGRINEFEIVDGTIIISLNCEDFEEIGFWEMLNINQEEIEIIE